jgi:hypothetical protein
MRSVISLALLAGLVGMGAPAAGQEALLSGPSVGEEASAATLIERDYEGKLRPLEVRAEFAAVDLLGLSPGDRAAADAVIAERGALVETVVFDNLVLLTELKTARAAAAPGGDPLGGNRELRRKMSRAMEPLNEGGPLVDRMAAALPEASRGEYRRLVEEWYDAAAQEMPSEGGGRRGKAFAVRLRALGEEIRAAYERGVAGRTERLDEIVAVLDLTPEQEGEVREIIRRSFTESGGKPTEAQRSAVIQAVFEKLTPDQRRTAIEHFRGG